MKYLGERRESARKYVSSCESRRREEREKARKKEELARIQSRVKAVLSGMEKNTITRPVSERLSAPREKNLFQPLLMQELRRRNRGKKIMPISIVRHKWNRDKSRVMITSGPAVSKTKTVNAVTHVEIHKPNAGCY